MATPFRRAGCQRPTFSRGYSLVEALVVALILAMLVTATAQLLNTGVRQQRLARSYSQVQVDLRNALRRATRGMRHGYRVVGTSTQANFSAAPSSGSTQVIVLLPQSAGSPIEARYHVSNGALYVQSQGEVAPGTALLSGVTAHSFTYFRTIGAVRSAAPTPADATEVVVSVSGRYGVTTTRAVTMVALRNRLAGTP